MPELTVNRQLIVVMPLAVEEEELGWMSIQPSGSLASGQTSPYSQFKVGELGWVCHERQ